MHYPVFLSVVLVVYNDSEELEVLLDEVSKVVAPLVSDYELIVIDNASHDDSISKLKKLTGKNGLPNLQVYALTKNVDSDTASWVGLENALGDFVAVIAPMTDDINFLPSMLDAAIKGADAVFAMNEYKPRESVAYQACASLFNSLYKLFHRIDLAKEAPQYRLLSKRMVNFILQHPTPSLAYRHLPATGGFAKATLRYSGRPKGAFKKMLLLDSIGRGLRLLISSTRGPMRLATSFSLFGAFANLVYSGYVIAVAIFKNDVAPGWVTLSLQQSGMFFLISLVLFVVGEYILHITSIATEGPLYHVGQEFTSAVMTRREKLNIEESRQDNRQAPRAFAAVGRKA